MNYLAHAVLSYNNPHVLFGNMIGDFVKGTESYQKLHGKVRKGIDLHRVIDAYTDTHPAAVRIQHFYRPDYRLYSGAITDVVLDYFLANDPQIFNHYEDLHSFTLSVFGILDNYAGDMPDAYAHMYAYMKRDNWLYDIRTLKGLERALHRLHRKAAYMPHAHIAYELTAKHYYEINQCYFELITDIERIVKDWLRENF